MRLLGWCPRYPEEPNLAPAVLPGHLGQCPSCELRLGGGPSLQGDVTRCDTGWPGPGNRRELVMRD